LVYKKRTNKQNKTKKKKNPKKQNKTKKKKNKKKKQQQKKRDSGATTLTRVILANISHILLFFTVASTTPGS
jgi:hypothetical protein